MKVEVFSQPTCPACNQLKEYLKQKGVTYEDHDITADPNALDELLRVHKVRVTPLVIVDDRKLVGFDPVELERLLTAEN